VLLCIARDPGARLRDIAASVGITERSAHAIVSDLAGAGYVVRQKDGRRNRSDPSARSIIQRPCRPHDPAMDGAAGPAPPGDRRRRRRGPGHGG